MSMVKHTARVLTTDKVPQAPCRQCDEMVHFTTRDGRLIALDMRTMQPHPCKNP